MSMWNSREEKKSQQRKHRSHIWLRSQVYQDRLATRLIMLLNISNILNSRQNVKTSVCNFDHEKGLCEQNCKLKTFNLIDKIVSVLSWKTYDEDIHFCFLPFGSITIYRGTKTEPSLTSEIVPNDALMIFRPKNLPKNKQRLSKSLRFWKRKQQHWKWNWTPWTRLYRTWRRLWVSPTVTPIMWMSLLLWTLTLLDHLADHLWEFINSNERIHNQINEQYL